MEIDKDIKAIKLETKCRTAVKTGIDKVKYIAGLIVLTPEFNTLY